MDLDWTFLDSERALLLNLPNVRGPWLLWPPGSYVLDKRGKKVS